MGRCVGLPKIFRDYQNPAVFRSPDLPIPEVYSPRGRWISGAMHTFTDDYRQEFFWRRPHEGLIVACCAQAVTAPDFTVWTDDPSVWAEFQAWRSAVVAQFWSDHGCDVLPVISFGSSCYRWVLPGSAWAVRGPVRGASSWRDQIFRFIDSAHPALLVVFGNSPADSLPVPVVHRRLVSRQVDIAAQKEGSR